MYSRSEQEGKSSVEVVNVGKCANHCWLLHRYNFWYTITSNKAKYTSGGTWGTTTEENQAEANGLSSYNSKSCCIQALQPPSSGGFSKQGGSPHHLYTRILQKTSTKLQHADCGKARFTPSRPSGSKWMQCKYAAEKGQCYGLDMWCYPRVWWRWHEFNSYSLWKDRWNKWSFCWLIYRTVTAMQQ